MITCCGYALFIESIHPFFLFSSLTRSNELRLFGMPICAGQKVGRTTLGASCCRELTLVISFFSAPWAPCSGKAHHQSRHGSSPCHAARSQEHLQCITILYDSAMSDFTTLPFKQMISPAVSRLGRLHQQNSMQRHSMLQKIVKQASSCRAPARPQQLLMASLFFGVSCRRSSPGGGTSGGCGAFPVC